MTNFTDSEERRELRRQVAKLASKYGREYFTEKARTGGKTTDLWLEMGKNGYLGINIPEEYGGGGGGIGDIAAVCEELQQRWGRLDGRRGTDPAPSRKEVCRQRRIGNGSRRRPA